MRAKSFEFQILNLKLFSQQRSNSRFQILMLISWKYTMLLNGSKKFAELIYKFTLSIQFKLTLYLFQIHHPHAIIYKNSSSSSFLNFFCLASSSSDNFSSSPTN
mmetsp:Transcript_28068/g.41977  ORF Transcript_28068/g.41977 Transcript_28068/m.41977 type:complete len:104 (+) Transcript_28068:244-555(+)